MTMRSIIIIRSLLLAQLWAAIPVTSTEGLLRGSGDSSRELRNDEDGESSSSWNDNDSTTVDGDIHHQAIHNKSATIQQRIIGGSKARSDRYSYTVQFIDSMGLYCGGVLISSDMVLTAAHCGDGKKEKFKMVIGTAKVGSGGDTIKAERGWVHRDYDYDTMDSDYMIYQLERSVEVDATVITLNERSSSPSKGETLVALGWGNTKTNGQYVGSKDLLEVGVGYIPNSDCKERSGYVGKDYIRYRSQVTDNMLCALGNGKDGCQGDSGGPLVIEGSDSKGRKDVLVGLVSWGVSCAHETLPGVYSRISSKYSWIKKIVCEESKDPAASFKCAGRNVDSGGGGGGGGGKNSNGKNKPNRKKKGKKKKNKNKTRTNRQRVVHRRELFSE
jgi:trypsin